MNGRLDRAEIVIVGNGIAGITAALEARRLAPEKRIVVISSQLHPPIHTPALKQFACARLEREQLLVHPAGIERQQRIHVITSRVEEIQAQSQYLLLSGNRPFHYGKLLLATGSVPQGLPETLPGQHFDGVLTLHRLRDYLDLRRRLPTVQEAVVIGGGAHAVETVMTLLYWGIRTHWLLRGEYPLSRQLDAQGGALVRETLHRAGAIIHQGTEVVDIVGRIGVVVGVITNQRKMIPCQLVLVCTGSRPAIELSERCSMPLCRQHGILVDDLLRTNVPNIFAAGDVAAIRDPQTNRYAPRAQWYAAGEQGRIAGAMLADRPDLTRPPLGVSWHATHLGELSLLIAGNPHLQYPGIETLTDASQGGYRRLALFEDRLIGYLSLGHIQPDSLAIKRLIEEGHSVRPILKALLKGGVDAHHYFARLQAPPVQALPLINSQPERQRLPITGKLALTPEQLPLLAGSSPTGPSPKVPAGSSAYSHHTLWSYLEQKERP